MNNLLAGLQGSGGGSNALGDLNTPLAPMANLGDLSAFNNIPGLNSNLMDQLGLNNPLGSNPEGEAGAF